LEEERGQVNDVVDSQTWFLEAGHTEEVDDESSISEQARGLDHAVERNISLGSELYVDRDLSGDVSEPLAVRTSLLYFISVGDVFEFIVGPILRQQVGLMLYITVYVATRQTSCSLMYMWRLK